METICGLYFAGVSKRFSQKAVEKKNIATITERKFGSKGARWYVDPVFESQPTTRNTDCQISHLHK